MKVHLLRGDESRSRDAVAGTKARLQRSTGHPQWERSDLDLSERASRRRRLPFHLPREVRQEKKRETASSTRNGIKGVQRLSVYEIVGEVDDNGEGPEKEKIKRDSVGPVAIGIIVNSQGMPERIGNESPCNISN